MDDGAAGIGAKSGQGEHCSTPIGARTRMFEADFGRSQGWHRPKCRLRRSVRPVGRDEGTREAGGLPGEDFWCYLPRERVFPKSLAKPRSGGETPSRAKPSPNKKPQPKGCGFLLGQPVGTKRPIVLRHGASWSCRRCLPARFPSR